MNPSAPVLWFDELDSTNAEARRRADAGETGPLWIAARRQTEGRGRRGRVWESPEGNLYATLLTTTDKPPSEAAQLSFVVALAVAEVCDGWLIHSRNDDERATLKWPNDVLIGGRKVAGILVESGRRLNGDLWLAVGVGLNLSQAPVAPERPATRLADHFRGEAPPTLEAALQSLAGAFGGWQLLWDRGGFEPIRMSWIERAHGLGQPCTARLGSETVDGVADGLELDGALRLRLQDGSVRRIHAGDVFAQSAP